MLTEELPLYLRTNKEGYRFLSNLYFSVFRQEEKETCVDFSRCIDIDANLFAAFGAILDRLMADLKCSIRIVSPKNENLAQKMVKTRFSGCWGENTEPGAHEEYVRYDCFNNASSVHFKEYIRGELLNKQKFPKHTELVGNEIIENIFEIYVNAITHGETNFVYICGEYKKFEDVLEMSVVNFGRTIPRNVNGFLLRRGQKQKSPCEAIEWAFERGNTTKEETGGLGLALLKEFIGMNEGDIQLVSGAGMMEYKDGQLMPTPLDFEFPGTIVKMKFNFADPKRYFMKSEKVDMDNIL